MSSSRKKPKGRQKRTAQVSSHGSPRGQAAPLSTQASTESSAEEIRVFLSYARADDRSYGMVRPFKDLLRTLVHAKSGRQITAFLDQDDIKWGEIWKDRLDAEILRSTVFIPLLSANYLESSMCRMEFNKFHAAADILGVSELIFPVMLIDAPAVFNQSSSDDLVQLAIKRQYEVIEDAALSDPKSSEWKRTMARLADRFTEAYQAAETTLAQIDPDQLAVPSDDDDEDDERLGLAELFDLFQSGIGKMTTEAEAIVTAIESLGKAVTSVEHLPENPTPREIQQWSLRAANALSDPSQELSDRGEGLLKATQELDKTIAGFGLIVADVPEYREPFTAMLDGLGGLDDVRQQLQFLLDSMKPAESISIPLRRAIRPASRGLTRVTDAISIIGTWR